MPLAYLVPRKTARATWVLDCYSSMGHFLFLQGTNCVIAI